MRPDLVLTYRHCAFTAKPSYVGVEIAQGVAISARQQLGLEDGGRLAVDLDMLTSIRRVQVNDVASTSNGMSAGRSRVRRASRCWECASTTPQSKTPRSSASIRIP